LRLRFTDFLLDQFALAFYRLKILVAQFAIVHKNFLIARPPLLLGQLQFIWQCKLDLP